VSSGWMHGMPANDVLVACVVAVIGVAASLLAAPLGQRWLEWIGKPAASVAFLALAFSRSDDSAAARWFLVALSLAALGDLFLLGRATPAFLTGLGAFLL